MDNAPLRVGQAAPDFELLNQDRQPVKLSSFRGKKKVVLLFYPMDFSSVCTQEHCAFGPRLSEIAPDDKTIVFGVSCDSVFCHAAFKKQFNIPYDLLADPTRHMVKAYGMFGGELPWNCSKRGTVVVGIDGNISHWHEQPMKEARPVADIVHAVAGMSAGASA